MSYAFLSGPTLLPRDTASNSGGTPLVVVIKSLDKTRDQAIAVAKRYFYRFDMTPKEAEMVLKARWPVFEEKSVQITKALMQAAQASKDPMGPLDAKVPKEATLRMGRHAFENALKAAYYALAVGAGPIISGAALAGLKAGTIALQDVTNKALVEQGLLADVQTRITGLSGFVALGEDIDEKGMSRTPVLDKLVGSVVPTSIGTVVVEEQVTIFDETTSALEALLILKVFTNAMLRLNNSLAFVKLCAAGDAETQKQCAKPIEALPTRAPTQILPTNAIPIPRSSFQRPPTVAVTPAQPDFFPLRPPTEAVPVARAPVEHNWSQNPLVWVGAGVGVLLLINLLRK
jgi:hypothetical protein